VPGIAPAPGIAPGLGTETRQGMRPARPAPTGRETRRSEHRGIRRSRTLFPTAGRTRWAGRTRRDRRIRSAGRSRRRGRRRPEPGSRPELGSRSAAGSRSRARPARPVRRPGNRGQSRLAALGSAPAPDAGPATGMAGPIAQAPAACQPGQTRSPPRTSTFPASRREPGTRCPARPRRPQPGYRFRQTRTPRPKARARGGRVASRARSVLPGRRGTGAYLTQTT
jgi:hypothetical protein